MQLPEERTGEQVSQTGHFSTETIETRGGSWEEQNWQPGVADPATPPARHLAAEDATQVLCTADPN